MGQQWKAVLYQNAKAASGTGYFHLTKMKDPVFSEFRKRFIFSTAFLFSECKDLPVIKLSLLITPAGHSNIYLAVLTFFVPKSARTLDGKL